MTAVGMNERGHWTRFGQNAQMLGHRTRPHAKQQDVAGHLLALHHGLQDRLRGLQQHLLPGRLAPVCGVGWHNARLIAVNLAPDAAQKAQTIRARALELLEDERHLVQILHSGADKARTVASATVAESYKNLGLVL